VEVPVDDSVLVGERVPVVAPVAEAVVVCVAEPVLVTERLAVEVGDIESVVDMVEVALVVAEVRSQPLNSCCPYSSSTLFRAAAAPSQVSGTCRYAALNDDPRVHCSDAPS
jgi:hypothetical protein